MTARKVFVPVAMALTLLMLFLPGKVSANSISKVEKNSNPSYTASTTYDFMANACAASWSSGAGALPCPGTDGDSRGFVLNVATPTLENGATSSTPGLVVNPQQVNGGYIEGVYPAYTVQMGDRFQGTIDCAYNAPNCYVNFRLMYKIGGGPMQTFWSFNERYEGLYYNFNINLSSLAGQSVNFILYTGDVIGHGIPSGDRAGWVGARIVGYNGGGYTPPPPPYSPGYNSNACNRGYFVADETIADGTVMAPGASFTKTWRITNVGTCTWTTSYNLLYVFGNPMGAPTTVPFPSSVAPGQTADFSVNMVAPTAPGHYRSYWRFQDGSGVQFGVGSGMVTFFADIDVSPTVYGPHSTSTTITAHTPNPSTPGQTVIVSVTVNGYSSTPTGTVAITGADSNCTLTLSGGSGSCNVVFNTAGTKTLTAVYGGDWHNAGSSGTASHSVSSVSPNSSTTTITSDAPDPSAVGQSVPVSVTVSGSVGTPTGTVSVTGANTNCTITLSGGSGSCNVVFTSVGSKTITATYTGDSNYVTSSDTESHTVSSLSASTTTITADTPDPSIPGQVVDVEVTVAGTGTYPTGTVAITGADTNCTLTLTGDGTGACNVIFNSVGAKTLTAVYSGNANYTGSMDTESHTVGTGKAATATNITSNVPDPSTPGQAVVVSVTVSGAGLPAPTGTVAITGADTNCNILLAGGSGSCSVVFTTVGHKTISATYSGDGAYASSSGSIGHTVIKGSTTTTIIGTTPDPSQPTQSVEVSFTVLGAGVTPTGTVAITGADVNCTITLSGGNGSCNVVFNTIGIKLITATYSGDANYLSSTATANHTVKNASTTAITSDNPDPSHPGETVSVSFTVSVPGSPAPTGIVQITGADSTCSHTLILADNGSFSCNVVFNTAGAKVLTASYAGDTNYTPSSGTANHTVVKGPSTTGITGFNPASSVPFQSVEVDVTVSGAGVTPTGTVAVTISGVSSTCTMTLSSGSGSCNVVFNATGTYTVTATYSGDPNYLSSLNTQSYTVH